MGESPTIELGSRFEPDPCDIDFQTDPLAHCGELAQTLAADCVLRAPIDEVFSPVGAMLPRAIIKLQHDLLWGVVGVEVDMSEKGHAPLNNEGRGGTGEVVLAQSLGLPNMRAFAGKNGLRMGHEFPRSITSCDGLGG